MLINCDINFDLTPKAQTNITDWATDTYRTDNVLTVDQLYYASKEFAFNNTTHYKYYRIHISEAGNGMYPNDHRATSKVIGELALYKSELVQPPPPKYTQFDSALHIYKNENDKIVSSEAIRKSILSLDFKFVKSCLGRNWALTGIVQKGDQNGRKLGFATANIHLLKTLEPKFGVYFTRSRIMNHDGSYFTSTHMPSITNFGIRPTLDGQKKLFETHILNYEEYFKNNEIYDQRIYVEVLDFLRDEKKFNSFEELKDQILKDVEKAKFFHKNK